MPTKTIRVSDADDKLIDEFLKKNRVLDFSTLARIAIKRFIQNPSITLESVSSDRIKKKNLRGNRNAEPRI
ncbi:MAG: hypothetical protein IPL83_07315 [Bdellovibrionales bacterium]|nr:hypothetical protein [Bdellovibrionales bacterium]